MSTVIQVENLCKTYRLGAIGGGTLRTDVSRWLAKLQRKPDPTLQIGQEHHARLVGQEFKALQDVSFEVKQGEILGVIGRNGAGKSTLLKILSRVTAPTSGEVRVKGRIASLLEVGTGFHPELTGRENIFLNGAILGMSKVEIKKKFDEIAAFSEINEFIDTPVKRYSSGMYVRLAFAVAAHLEPEILIVDEVLAVGDVQFQKKCLGKMQDVSKGGRTVLFVSHNMTAITSLCSNAITMKSGTVISSGSVATCIESYLSGIQTSGLSWERIGLANEAAPVTFTKVSLELQGQQPAQTLQINCETESVQKHKPAFVAADILDDAGVVIMQALPTLECLIKSDSSANRFCINIQLPPLVPGHYSVTLWMGPHNTETYEELASVVSFDITETPTKGRSYPHSRNHGYIVPISSLRF